MLLQVYSKNTWTRHSYILYKIEEFVICSVLPLAYPPTISVIIKHPEHMFIVDVCKFPHKSNMMVEWTVVVPSSMISGCG